MEDRHMSLQGNRAPLWHANYKSMTPAQLTGELEQIAKYPHRYDERAERIGVIGRELSLRRHKADAPIILLTD
jgi:hypothetical protein